MVALFDLTGRVALVTGSSRGIGRSLAAGLADAGASIVLNGLDENRLEMTRSALEQEYGPSHVHGAAFDVTSESAVDDAVAWIEAEIGPIDILINNAGVQRRVPLLDLEVKDWEMVLNVNVTSAFLVGRAVARGMVRRGRGKIINIGSVQSELARPTIAAYTAAKGAVRNLTRAMAAEWGSSNIQVNAIAPGYIHTDMTQALVDDPAFNDWVLGRSPAGRWGQVSDLVGPAVWLASDASGYVNGQTIFVDGGMTVVV